MKKMLSCLLAVILASLLGATNSTDIQLASAENHTFKIVATTFPSYDWTRQILGDHLAEVELTLLLDSGVDLHNFQPSVDDIAIIASCDLLIYVGGESDAWVPRLLEATASQSRSVINLLDALGSGVKLQEIVPGMEHDEHDIDDEDHEDNAHEHEEEPGEADEHVWLSLKNAQALCARIAEELGKLDPRNASDYAANAARYQLALTALDTQYQNAMNDAATKTLLFADRFPFRYLVDDYQLEYYAAFSGCSAETEASFETIVFLTEKLNEFNLRYVMVTEGADHSIARTIIQNSAAKNQSILVLDSMQSITANNVTDGTTYLSLMENNLEVLKNAVK